MTQPQPQLTRASQTLVRNTLKEAQRRKSPEVTPVHLLACVLDQPVGALSITLKSLPIELNALRADVDVHLDRYAKVYSDQEPQPNRDLEKVIERAQSVMQKMDDRLIAIEHIFAGLFSDTASQDLLEGRGLKYREYLRALNEARAGKRVHSESAEEGYESLERYTRDLTHLALHDQLDPVIGRDAEVRRVLKVLQRRTKKADMGIP